MPKTPDEFALDAGKIFTPTAPIDERSLFAGRQEQIRLVIDAINQKGQHAILYGERGVGKTSLANVLSSFLGGSTLVLAPRVNCDSLDNFESIWKKVFDEIQLNRQMKGAGFTANAVSANVSAAALLEEPIAPDTVRRALTIMSQNALPILIVDEFDRLPKDAKRAFADTIKNLSDHAVAATVILVGVANSIEELIEEHQSVERALVQIRMPRMSEAEIKEIIQKGLVLLDLSIRGDALSKVTDLTQGLPHYAHLLGLHSSRIAIDKGEKAISMETVDEAIRKALSGVNESIRNAWHIATLSPRKDNLFADVLLACALAETDARGFFAAQNVREALRVITGKPYEIYSFAQHLNEFCDAKRGPILEKIGSKRRFKYRFVNPLMQPYVIMHGLGNGKISDEKIKSIRNQGLSF